MKKLLMTILSLCFVALLCVTLIACNPTDKTPDEDPNQGGHENPKYTVEFKTNGGTGLPEAKSKLYDVEYGSHIHLPVDVDGNAIKPVKPGYTFLWWSANNKDEFKFTSEGISEAPITSSLLDGSTGKVILTAVYENNVYKHTAVLRAKVEYNADGTFKRVNEEARPEGDVYFTDAEADEKTSTLKSTFNTKTALPCPKIKMPELGPDDEYVSNAFCFWFYLDSGVPKQFSAWGYSSVTTIDMLSAYSFDKGLVLYPMFEDNLPTVRVKYWDDIRYNPENPIAEFEEKEYAFGKNIPIDEKPEYSKSGYVFDYWYYIAETDDPNNSGEKIKTHEKFVFEEKLDETDPDKTYESPTGLKEAAGAIDNFSGVTLNLYAKCTKKIQIWDLQDYKEKLYNPLHVNVNEFSEVEIEDLLLANINFCADINFGSEKFEPLFDSEHVFKGMIDGGKYDPDDQDKVTGKYAIKAGVFSAEGHASVFGYSDGVIKNLIFDDVMIEVAHFEIEENVVVYMGAVTTRNGGSIVDCEVSLVSADNSIELLGEYSYVFGGVTALNSATSSTTGIVTGCTVDLKYFSADCFALKFGGVAGESSASATVSDATVNVEISDVKCNSMLKMGGIVGANSGAILRSSVKMNAEKVQSLEEFLFGGVAGSSAGSVELTDANVKLGSEDNYAKAGGSLHLVYVGGMVGKNDGWATNSYSNANLYVSIEGTPQSGTSLSVGGIMGSNYSDKMDTSSSSTRGTGAINYCYSIGEIAVKVANELKNVTVYVGGIAGRNSQGNVCRISSVFSTVSINVTNADDNCNIGHLFGSMENNASVNGKCYYTLESKIVLNGKEYIRVNGEEEGKFTEPNFELINVGEATVGANFTDSGWAVSTKDKESKLGFTDSVWEVKDGVLTLKEPRSQTK